MAEPSEDLLSRGLAKSVRKPPPSGVSRMDKLLGLSVSPASVQSMSSETTDVNETEELDEEDIWAVEIKAVQTVSNVEQRRGQTSSPLRVVVEERAGNWGRGGFDGGRYPPRSLEKDSSVSQTPVVARGLNGFPQDHSPKSPTGRRLSREGSSRRIPTASRMIPRSIPQEDTAKRAVHQSAPVNIPDWSKILKVGRPSKGIKDDSDDEQDDEDEERLPPHEIMAREYARSQMTTFSVFEGAGRTLKGRDLSRVRNAVLTQTGFLE